MRACAKFAAACILGAALSSQGAALAAELIILTNQGATPGVRELGAAFERASGHKVTVIQEEGAALEQRLSNGRADLITGNPGVIEGYVKNGKVVASLSRRPSGVCPSSGNPTKPLAWGGATA